MGLTVAAGGFYDHGEDAGFVACDDKRDVTIDGYFSLEQLLAGGVDVSGVGEGDSAAKLLDDCDAGGGVAESAEVIGIDFDRAGAEELLDAAADGGVEGAAEQRIGGGIADGLLLLLGVEALLVGGVAEREQCDDVGLGERRIAAVGDAELLRRSLEAEGDVVVLDMGRGAEIDDRLDADRVGEGDVAALRGRSGFRR